jgi:hypothetical protein
MVIGIDESGNFDDTSNLRQFFIAAFIESENGKLEIKKQQYLRWENQLPVTAKNPNGEVKGSFLNKQQLHAFLGTVIIQPPFVRTAMVSIVPNKTPPFIIDKYQQLEIKQADYNLSVFTQMGAKKRNLNFLDNYARWQKKRTRRDYLKMLCLKNLLKNSFHNIIINTIENDRIEEALDIYYKIDRDFLTEENIYWEHYSRSSIQNYTRIEPWPILDTWDAEHPFLKKYTDEKNGNKTININLVYQNLKFLDSRDHIEIRIADVLGIIVNRFYNRNELKLEFDLLSKTGIVRDDHLELRFYDFDVEDTFNQFVKDAQ